MFSSRESFEVVIIGGGIAGNALATVLARAGKSVLVLERSTVYRDRVRGEVFQPWDVAELGAALTRRTEERAYVRSTSLCAVGGEADGAEISGVFLGRTAHSLKPSLLWEARRE